VSKAKQPESDFRKLLDLISRSHGLYKVFQSFTVIAACTLACQTREREYLEAIKGYSKEELSIFAQAFGTLVSEMETHPFEDRLGVYYMEAVLSNKGQQWNGEFHTPGCISEMMASLTLGEEWQNATEPITVCEPACGSGAMILALGKVCPPKAKLLRVTAIDINRMACDMCFINTTLWGIPARIIHGNTLTMELWAGWSNIHYMLPWLPYAMSMNVKPEMPEAKEQGLPPRIEEKQKIAAAIGQQQLEL
jgi:type I restriction-modification system DNA methylase subunit